MKKILLVDDDKDLCQSLEKVLREHGYDVVQAHSAKEGLKKALEVKPDAIVLDVLMETDTAGFEFVYQLRDERADSYYAAIKNTPVVFLTAINQITHFRFSLSDKDNYLPPISGMLTKPVQLEDLLAKLKQIA